ncbi:MAG: hypothetical protein ACOH18_02635 [Candidatus Saccharimonadaceae bacterium]
MSYSPGSANKISTAQDVTLTSLSDNEVLTYESTSQRWKNKAQTGSDFADIVSFGAVVNNLADDYQAWVDAIASVSTNGGMVGSSKPGRSLINLAANSSTGITVPTGVIIIGQGTHQAPSGGGGQSKQLVVKATGAYAGAGSAVFRTSGFEAGMKSINVYAGALADYAVYTAGAEEVYEDVSFAGGKVTTWRVASGANTSHASSIRLIQDQTSNRTVDAMCLDHSGIDWSITSLSANNGGGPTVPNCRFSGSVSVANLHITSGGAGGVMELGAAATTSMFDNVYLDGCRDDGPFIHIKTGGGTSTSFGQVLFFQSGSGLTGSPAIVLDTNAGAPLFGGVNVKAGVGGSAFSSFLVAATAAQAKTMAITSLRGTNAITGGAANLWNYEPGNYAYYDQANSNWATPSGASVVYMVVVTHGSNASMARPTGASAVLWVGTVTPTNMTTADIYNGP